METALIYFEVMTTVALAVGLLLAYVLRPGAGDTKVDLTMDAPAIVAAE